MNLIEVKKEIEKLIIDHNHLASIKDSYKEISYELIEIAETLNIIAERLHRKANDKTE